MVNETTTEERFMSLLQKGIADAKGSAETIAFLTDEDVVELGKTLANREAAAIGELFSAIITPCNNLSEAIKKGGYDGGVYDHITEQTVPLTPAEGAKRVYFLPVKRNVDIGQEEAYVNEFGLTLCKNAPNYLLGAMVQLSEDKLPDSLKGKDLVAADSSVFRDKNGDRCFLYAFRSAGWRSLGLVDLGYWGWGIGNYWVFLAERP